MAFCPPVVSRLPGVLAGLLWDGVPVVMLSATSAWSAFTVTCFTVICCWPRPRCWSSRSVSIPTVRQHDPADGRHFARRAACGDVRKEPPARPHPHES
jgi:hypothetical protein